MSFFKIKQEMLLFIIGLFLFAITAIGAIFGISFLTKVTKDVFMASGSGGVTSYFDLEGLKELGVTSE